MRNRERKLREITSFQDKQNYNYLPSFEARFKHCKFLDFFKGFTIFWDANPVSKLKKVHLQKPFFKTKNGKQFYFQNKKRKQDFTNRLG